MMRDRPSLTDKQCLVANGHFFSASSNTNQRRPGLYQNDGRCRTELERIWLMSELLKTAHIFSDAGRVVVVVTGTCQQQHPTNYQEREWRPLQKLVPNGTDGRLLLTANFKVT